ncbi:MAG: hypothetical protein QOH74_285 [Gaiellales bacterium]|nr:hypothetical protein [Gaiellales bacterium]
MGTQPPWPSSLDGSSIPRYPRAVKSRGLLFVVLAVGLAAIGLAAANAGVWVIAAASVALAVWMGDLARRDLGR